MFEPVSSKPDFARIEEAILGSWERDGTFARSVSNRRGCPEFVFFDGPPFATGLPHYGHLLAGMIKDIVPRYMAMRGRYVDRRFGWDCHGLPVEYEVEQDLQISGKSEIEKLGVDVFNERCRSIVLRYTGEWQQIVTRMGRWVDFDRDYKTMDAPYMESIWWVFKSLWDRGLIYEGNKILPYCPRCATPLSNFETNQGYEDVTDPAVTVRFRLLDEDGAFVLAWTTTPWTLPSNLALAVGPEIAYVRVRDGDRVYYLAAARLEDYYPASGPAPDEVTELPGRDLAGRRYEPLFPYFRDKEGEGAFRIVPADFVSTEEGTGVVHIAPGFGEDDHRLALERGLPEVCPVDAEARFTEPVTEYAGRSVRDTDGDLMDRLEAEGKLVRRGTIRHSYPHCWRCDTPLIYRAIATWFVRVESLKDRLLRANAGVRWVPEHLRDGRFGKWLAGARDWAISRNRYWGTPLPVWRSADGKETVCIGSIAELEQLSGRRVTDLHKHVLDNVPIPSATGQGMLQRIPEVLDCWFESGAMPYAQAHYPFENRAHFENHFPADFIAEGLDQTRGWFYTLLVLSVALFDKPAFRNVVVNGLVLAEDGRKMSKRLKNYPDPVYILDTYGADALRLYMLNSPVVRAEDLCFSEEGVKRLLRHVLLPLWNAYSFFVTYARVDRWTPDGDDGAAGNVLDRWIRSALETLAGDVTRAMDGYDLQGAVRPFVRFIEDLTNWYIRRSRRRFWKSTDDEDKAQAYRTLWRVLVEFSKIAAPFLPFISEAIYRNLRTEAMPESVHLCDFPEPDPAGRDPELEKQMADVLTVVRLGRQLRVQSSLKVRQPLAALHVVSRDRRTLARLQDMAALIEDELNLKQVTFDPNESALATLKAKPNYRRLGPRLGAGLQDAARAISSLPASKLEILAEGGRVHVEAGGEPLDLAGEDVIIARLPRRGLAVLSDGPLIVALETELTGELIREGLAREFVNKVQNMRKAADLNVTRRIRLVYHADEAVRQAVERHRPYVHGETLCLGSEHAAAPPAGGTDWDLNGHPCRIRIIPAEAGGDSNGPAVRPGN